MTTSWGKIMASRELRGTMTTKLGSLSAKGFKEKKTLLRDFVEREVPREREGVDYRQRTSN